MSRSFQSIISPVGYSSSTCGYCSPPGQRSSSKTSHSFGIWAHDLSAEHYQRLADAGWRRSGSYVYKPDLAATCCKQISIRLEGQKFKVGKSGRKTMRRFVEELRGAGEEGEAELVRQRDIWGKGKGKGKYTQPTSLQDFFAAIEENEDDGPMECRPSTSSDLSLLHQQRHDLFTQWRKDSPPCTSTPRPPPPTYPPRLPKLKHKLRTRLVPGSSSAQKYALFRRYQQGIHKESDEDISSRKGFERFLCESPVRRTFPDASEDPDPSAAHRLDGAVNPSGPSAIPFGLYHLEWRLDDELVAVSVLDLLPHCLSSVYFFYDPKHEKLQLGKISVLREVALLERIRAKPGMEEVKWYYLGFYIHNCQKMRYKGNYRPSQLLDAEDGQWVDLDEACPVLDTGKGYGFSKGKGTMGEASSMEASIAVKSPEPSSPSSSSSDQSSASDSSLLPSSRTPCPGILDPASLDPNKLAKQIYVLESSRQRDGIKPMILSRLEGRDQEKVKEAVAALGWEMARECVFFV
ncbi:hypothetical protein BCV69DRAFT_282356 [Microstroma glucosiphilum]|uniref:arginyltransferase n=1 Tax=Pseudomicrostroma glucosiphilum TaxID=1684307 RepID=A0A316U8Q7_9BASI|nr:hypothetical protein BCV69DRAFT_282356 [Pseudomicrostroma glucosiphilum]PWN21637.1 hypothetical protein BCV69DRAFT_282356 [Pseudomicrostroma glucosiphilum]